VPSAATNCPRCGARLAALPRHPRVERAPAPEATDGEPAASGRDGFRAGLRGIALGLVLTAGCALLAGAFSLVGGSAYTAFGNATLAAGGLCIVATAVAGGVRFTRWDEYAEMRRRVERTRQIGSRRVTLISAGLMLILVSGLTAARH
jgi:drug/metabolite transporter (DMT)-like permease